MSNTKSTDLSMLGFVCFQPSWLLRLAAFQSSDPAIVRASINMLIHAFQNDPCGTLPNTQEAIASATGLSVDAVKSNLKTLTTGWKAVKGVLHFEPMEKMAKGFVQDYGNALNRLQMGAVTAMAAPDLFNTELMLDQGDALLGTALGKTLDKAEDALKKTKALRFFPEGARPTRSILLAMSEKGLSEDDVNEMWKRFENYNISRNKQSADWGREFYHWFDMQVKFEYITLDSKGKVVKRGPASAAKPGVSFSRAEQARSTSASSFDRVNDIQSQVIRPIHPARPVHSGDEPINVPEGAEISRLPNPLASPPPSRLRRIG